MHPQDTIPVPIEDIVDQKYQIDIIPMVLSPFGIESFTSHDMSTIYMDKDVYDNPNTNRYRYSLAHELSHILLHEDIFKNAAFKDIAGWKAFTLSFGEDYKRIEWQAYTLAGIILVPTKHLLNEYSEIAKTLEAKQINVKNLGPNEIGYLAKMMGDTFNVSSAVRKRRAVAEALWTSEDVVD